MIDPQAQRRAVGLRLVEGRCFVVVPGRIYKASWQRKVEREAREADFARRVIVVVCTDVG